MSTLVTVLGAADGACCGDRRTGFDDALGGTLEVRESSFSVLPHLGYAFSPGSRTRFFLSASAGYQRASGESTMAGSTSRSESSGFLLGAGVGLLGFLTPRMSVDPAVSLLHFSGKGEAAGFDSSISGTVFLISVGLSGWLGGEDIVNGGPRPTEAKAESGAGPVAPPAEEPRPEPAAITRVTDEGVVTRSLRLESGTLVRVVGQPRKNGGHVLLSLSMVDAPPEGLESWNDCREGSLVSDGVRYPLTDVGPGPAGFGDTAVVRSRVRVGVLLKLVRAEQRGAFDFCGAELPLELEDRRAVLDFLRSFKEIADRYKTWDASLDRSNDAVAQPNETSLETPPAAPPETPETPEAPEAPTEPAPPAP